MNRIEQIIALYLTAHDTGNDISTAALRSLQNDAACKFYAREGNDYIILYTGYEYVAVGMTNMVHTDIVPYVETGMGNVFLHLRSDSYRTLLQAVTDQMLVDAE